MPLDMAQPVDSPAPVVNTASYDLLIVDTFIAGASYAPALVGTYKVRIAANADRAISALQQKPPALVILEMSQEDPAGILVCAAAKRLAISPAVLVMTPSPEVVPDALRAGCDSVLLKPFPPNQLHARIGRLLRARSATLRVQSHHQIARATHLTERSQLLMSGSNEHWPTSHCPYCTHQGIVMFDYASNRNAWFACLECRKVWMAKRLE